MACKRHLKKNVGAHQDNPYAPKLLLCNAIFKHPIGTITDHSKGCIFNHDKERSLTSKNHSTGPGRLCGHQICPTQSPNASTVNASKPPNQIIRGIVSRFFISRNKVYKRAANPAVTQAIAKKPLLLLEP